MDLSKIEISDKLVPENYLKLAQSAQKSKEVAVSELLEKRKLPEEGWSDERIEALVAQLAALDSNNFVSKVGLGEREAKIVCKLVAQRHYNFGHGIGRSGDLLEPQPKAAGSTILSNLTNALLLELIKEMGVRSCKSCFLVPMATGMSLMLCLLTLRKQRPQAKYVIWSRIDQKSCFKSITTANLIPIIIDTNYSSEKGLTTDLVAFENKLKELNVDDIVCVYTTTSCFAPRNADNIIEVAKLSARYKVPHLVNNAYGLQSTYITHQLEQANRLGRVDLFVQSTDKNLMVPVGGAVVAGFQNETVRAVAKTYAGRASSSQSLDVLMTLLSLGRNGYIDYVQQRKNNFIYLRNNLIKFANSHNEKVFESKGNPISLALSLETFKNTNITQIGSMLFTRGVSGVRVVTCIDIKDIDGYKFINWGTHSSVTNIPYLTVAATLGLTTNEIDLFFKKLEDCWSVYNNKFV
ncbi:O-phosphoseryl-tRNA(Sec) selenium transferase [Teleopsis dalmanni]|uniref:O-phosphoseryl-tRNA(Sec) selenium transferase n=1 Tax=Teleopsis dalmanni TaxID=139649 RepID=UPI0018CE3924|nr:O-phosphoseryl-tRNA(Sec) selenium transferase [Teleopsis dalmanni]